MTITIRSRFILYHLFGWCHQPRTAVTAAPKLWWCWLRDQPWLRKQMEWTL